MKGINEKFMFVQYTLNIVTKEEIFKYIWNSYGKTISFYISKIIARTETNFDDLFQDVMLKIYNNLDSYNPVYALGTWIYRITRNHCIDFFKGTVVDISIDENELLLKAEDNVENDFFKNEFYRTLHECFESLSPLEKEIAFLRLYEEHSFYEIARLLHANASTVKATFKRIQLKLQRWLKNYEEK